MFYIQICVYWWNLCETIVRVWRVLLYCTVPFWNFCILMLLFTYYICEKTLTNLYVYIPKRQKEEWKVGGRQVDICVHVGKGGGRVVRGVSGRVVGGVSGCVVGGVSHLWWGVLPAVQEQVTLTQLSTRGPEMETREGSSHALKAPLLQTIG
jgi:hypothetical protein